MAIALCGVKHAEKPICVAAEQCKAEAKRFLLQVYATVWRPGEKSHACVPAFSCLAELSMAPF